MLVESAASRGESDEAGGRRLRAPARAPSHRPRPPLPAPPACRTVGPDSVSGGREGRGRAGGRARRRGAGGNARRDALSPARLPRAPLPPFRPTQPPPATLPVLARGRAWPEKKRGRGESHTAGHALGHTCRARSTTGFTQSAAGGLCGTKAGASARREDMGSGRFGGKGRRGRRRKECGTCVCFCAVFSPLTFRVTRTVSQQPCCL